MLSGEELTSGLRCIRAALSTTELPDTCAPCGTRTRSPVLKGQETNPYPNGTSSIWALRFVGESNSCCLAENQVCCPYINEPSAASSGLEPELPGTKIRWASDYPTRHRWCVRRDSNPRAQRQLVYSQPRLALFASHAWHLTPMLPEQDSNLQSRIEAPAPRAVVKLRRGPAHTGISRVPSARRVRG
jgi:hypothetical protein